MKARSCWRGAGGGGRGPAGWPWPWPAAAVSPEGGFLSSPGRPGAEPPGLAVLGALVSGRASGRCAGRTARRAAPSREHGGAVWTLLRTHVHVRYPCRSRPTCKAVLGAERPQLDPATERREASDRVTGRPGTAGWEPCPSAGRSPAGADAAWRGLSLVSEAYLSGDPVCQALGRRWDTHALHGESAARGLRLCFQPWGNRGQGGPEKGERGRFPLQSPWPRTHTWAGVG